MSHNNPNPRWKLKNDSRWQHIRNYVAPGDRKQLAKDIERARDPYEMVGALYLTFVTAYNRGHIEGNVEGRRAA